MTPAAVVRAAALTAALFAFSGCAVVTLPLKVAGTVVVTGVDMVTRAPSQPY